MTLKTFVTSDTRNYHRKLISRASSESVDAKEGHGHRRQGGRLSAILAVDWNHDHGMYQITADSLIFGYMHSHFCLLLAEEMT
jgi:hypothetical protein